MHTGWIVFQLAALTVRQCRRVYFESGDMAVDIRSLPNNSQSLTIEPH